MITTDFTNETDILGPDQFDRWSQENFFKYAKDQLNIDPSITYKTEEINPEALVTNPLYSQVVNKIRLLTSRINRRKLDLQKITIGESLEESKVHDAMLKIEKLQEQIRTQEEEKRLYQQEKKTLKKKILFKELPEQEKFRQRHKSKQQFMNALKIIAYRAETALNNIMKSDRRFAEQSRSILQDIFTQEADFNVDKKNKSLTVSLHHLASRHHDQAVLLLIQELNASETIYPGTDLSIKYALV